MANTINDLYLKYVNKVGSSLEKDRYFQYLFEMIQAGEHTIQQHNRLMHKVVDEQWISIVEESLDAINNIIDKPRRFIATNEQLVPVELAKKISAESVRHLSRNTQFISTNESGDIMPSKILNVTTEESYDLYENRFIYHLIQRLVTFIDKRTDVIFWATGDEKRNRFCMESKVEDGYEEIDYKVEMVIKNRQSFAENDADNMPVFMRIDRVRRLTLSLRDSAFCSIMAGCAKVRSPIQRTNLMMKDPDYRTCYKLWQFLENYDDVGYTIQEIDTALEFDEEYLIQMYINLITNYTVFKSLLETDQRNIFDVPGKKQKTIKPKFIKKIQEEIVEDYDIEDVEIRKVLIEEVTQAQLDAEAKVEELTAQYKELEEVQQSLDEQIQTLYHQINASAEQAQEADRRAWDERKAKEEALARIDELTESLNTANSGREEAVKASEELSERLNQLQEEMSHTREELAASDERVMNLSQERDGLVQEKQEIIRQREQTEELLQQTKTKAAEELERTRTEAAAELEQMKSEAAETLRKSQETDAAELERTKAEAAETLRKSQEADAAELEQMKSEAAETLRKSQEADAAELERAKAEAAETLRKSQETDAAELERTKAEAAETLRVTQAAYEAERRETTEAQEKTVAEMQEIIARLNEELALARTDARNAIEEERQHREAAELRAMEEQRAREKAEVKAEGNRITKLLGNVIKDRRMSEQKLREQIRQELEAQNPPEMKDSTENEKG